MHSLEQWRELRWHFLGAGLTVTGSGLDHLNLSTQSGSEPKYAIFLF